MKITAKQWKVSSIVVAIVTGIALAWALVDQKRRIDEYDLMAAAARGDTSEIARLASRADINARFGGDGETALHRAAANGQLDAARFLVDHGANVNAVDSENNSPLLVATYRGHKAVVEFLLDKGAAVDAQEKRNGFTPLIQAVSKDDKALVAIFLKYGADTSLKTSDGRTAMDRATANGSNEIVVMLKAANTKKK